MNIDNFIFLNHRIKSKQEKIDLITLNNIDKIPIVTNIKKVEKLLIKYKITKIFQTKNINENFFDKSFLTFLIFD